MTPSPRPASPAGDAFQRHDCTAAVAARCVALAEVGPGTVVLEPGPGMGAITAALLAAGALVQGVELAPERLAQLRQRFRAAINGGRLVLHAGDASRIVPPLPAGWMAVGNPPFQITSALLERWLLAAPVGPAAMTLVLQREAAQRLCGAPGRCSRWSVLLHLAGEPRLAASLPRSATCPPSRVDLAVFSWHRREPGPSIAELRLVDGLLQRALAGPPTVAEALRGLATSAILRRQGRDHGWHPQDHPRAVPSGAWLPLARFLAGIGRL